jgi:hypothetical protein
MRLIPARSAIVLSVGLLLMAGAGRAQSPAPSVSIRLGPAQTVLSLALRQALGFAFGPPDGYLGVERRNDRYSFFVSAKSNTDCATPQTQGSYRLGGDLAEFNDYYGCAAVLEIGGAPDGYSFDRDYAGGGPITEFADHGRQTLLLVYHGEWHPGPDCNSVPWFYSSLGMAVSWNGGAHFASLGEIIQPHPTRAQGLGTPAKCDNAHVGSGTLVVADGDGNPLPPAALSDPARGYYYVFYTDSDPTLSPPCRAPAFCVAVARASRPAVIAAAAAGDTAVFPSLFRKYHQGGFTEPATGRDPNDAVNSGHYTPLIGHPTGQPTVLYDRRINAFLMAYESGGILYMQATANLLHWSGKPLPGGTAEEANRQIGYPTLVGEGADPDIGGSTPYLFYLSSVAPFPHWNVTGTNYVSRQVRITLR